MKVVVGLYLIQLVSAAGGILSDRRIRGSSSELSAENRLRGELDAMLTNASEIPVVLAHWAGLCAFVAIGLFFCFAEFRKGGNRAAGIRGTAVGLGVAAFAIFWPLAL